jgi:hypothetical protein
MSNSHRNFSFNSISDQIEKPLGFEKLQDNRRERFKIQRVAASVLGVDAKEKLQKFGKKYAQQIHRTCGCSWSALGENVELMRSIEHKTAHVKNVMTCGSVWSCPVCTAKIQERRRQEIAQAMNSHYTLGGQCIMVTLTAPHYSNQSLKDLRAMQVKALVELRKSSGSYTRMLKVNGFIGLIRSLEVTVSRGNGWHLHTHELWFVDKEADIQRITQRTLSRWEAACIKAGLLSADDTKQAAAFRRHSVDIKASAKCSDYLAKMDDKAHWGADREIAKQSTKKGKNSGFHPFGLLHEIAEKTDIKSWCIARFIEYTNAMKGSRQLFWSKYLKLHFAVNEKTDEQLLAEEISTLEHVKTISRECWYRICKAGARATLFDVIELKNEVALNAFLMRFRSNCEIFRPPRI